MEDHEQKDNQNKDTTSSNGSGNVTFTGEIKNSGGIVIGQNITTGNIIVQLDQSIKQNPNNEYLKGLKELTQQLEKEFDRYKVTEEKRTEIAQSIQDLQKEVKDLKPETEVDGLKPSQEKQIDAKTTTLIEKLVDALPAGSELIINLTPLSPFSKLIRGGVQKLIDAYKQYKESQS